MDFLANEEKQRIHAGALELARRAQASSPGIVCGLAGEGIGAEDTLAEIERLSGATGARPGISSHDSHAGRHTMRMHKQRRWYRLGVLCAVEVN